MADKQAAFTAPTGSYPPYVNATRREDGSVRLAVRSEANDDGSCGAYASIAIGEADWETFLQQMVAV